MANEGFSKNELRFVEEPPEQIEIECPICLQVMLHDPHLVSCCGHHFCGTCIERVKNTGDRSLCPYCKEEEFVHISDRDRYRFINGLRVYCTNKENGCQWNGELRNLLAHLNKGEREGECQFESVKCRYERCQEKPYRKDVENHERRKCNQRNVLCPYCQCILGTHEWITQEHYLQCTQYLIPCPNKCQNDKGFSRGNIEDHVSKECPLQPVECEFKWAGCHESPLRKDLPQHNIDSQLNHMSLIAETYGELKKECQELKKENRDLKRESETLKRENNNLKTENELWKNRSVSIINEKNYMKDKLTGVHNAVVGNEYSILPVTTTLGSETHFYTETCGRHMSVTGERGAFTFKVYEGIFDQPEQAPVSKVVFGYNNEVHTVTKNDFRCRHYQGETTSNIRQEFTVVVNRTLMAKISAYFKSETGSILIIDVQ